MVILVLTLLLKALVVVGEGDAGIPNLSGFSPQDSPPPLPMTLHLGPTDPCCEVPHRRQQFVTGHHAWNRTPLTSSHPPITPGPGEEERGVLAKNGVG